MTSPHDIPLLDRVLDSSGINLQYLICGICYDLLWKPVSCEHCEGLFCQRCIKRWLDQHPDNCPNKCSSFVEKRCNRILQNQLSTIKIACVYNVYGCGEVLEYDFLENHEAECGYGSIECPGCREKIFKKDFTAHENNCGSIELTCSSCSLRYKRCDAGSIHTEYMCQNTQIQQLRDEFKQTNNMVQTLTKSIAELKESFSLSQQASNASKQSQESRIQELSDSLKDVTSAVGRLCQKQTIPSIPIIPADAHWKQNAVTVAGGNGQGGATNQLDTPMGLFVEDDQTVIIADYYNHRIVEWKKDDSNAQVIAGGNGPGYRLDQLKYPTNVLIDKETDSLIIADWNNRRVVRWSRRNGTKQGEILIDNIDCWGLAMDDQRYLYVCDCEKHEVRRYRLRDMNGTLVAGGNGQGNGLNQLFEPTHLFVDQQQNVYVSDNQNQCVMKWNKGAKEGIVVAGGNGLGEALTQLKYPYGIFVDTLGTLYVADSKNHRVMRWSQGDKQGTVIVGGNGEGAAANQFNYPRALCFDRHGNLYVVDEDNHRVQRFDIIN